MGTSRLKQTQLDPSSAAKARPLWNLGWEEREGSPLSSFLQDLSPLPDGPLSCVDNPGTMSLAAQQNQTEFQVGDRVLDSPPVFAKTLRAKRCPFSFLCSAKPERTKEHATGRRGPDPCRHQEIL